MEIVPIGIKIDVTKTIEFDGENYVYKDTKKKVSKDELEHWRDTHDLRYYRVPLVIGTNESQDSIEGFRKGFI